MSKKAKSTIDWRGYTGDTVVLPICTRSPAVRGGNFKATLQALSEQVERIHLVLCDTLDRHNTGDETYSRDHGTQWLADNLPQIQSHFECASITRWDDVRNTRGFAERLTQLHDQYASNDTTKEIIHRTAGYYLNAKAERQKSIGQPFDRAAALKVSVDYLIEEYAGTAKYGADLNFTPEAYWGVYIKDENIFGTPSLKQLKTLPITINRLPAPIGA